jgi:hypothetical protein
MLVLRILVEVKLRLVILAELIRVAALSVPVVITLAVMLAELINVDALKVADVISVINKLVRV